MSHDLFAVEMIIQYARNFCSLLSHSQSQITAKLIFVGVNIHYRFVHVTCSVDLITYVCAPRDCRAGYKITVIDKSEKDWWKGKCLGGRAGYFPSAYVMRVESGQRTLQVTRNLQLAHQTLLRDQVFTHIFIHIYLYIYILHIRSLYIYIYTYIFYIFYTYIFIHIYLYIYILHDIRNCSKRICEVQSTFLTRWFIIHGFTLCNTTMTFFIRDKIFSIRVYKSSHIYPILIITYDILKMQNVLLQ